MASAREKSRPSLMTAYCKGCGRCIEACARGCIEDGTEIHPGSGLAPVHVHLDRCTSCGLCFDACPEPYGLLPEGAASEPPPRASEPLVASLPDFVRGAARSRGGKPIIALPSTAKGGRLSRVVDVLSEGSGVVTTRADVHFVVTEHGVASLHGRSIRERAEALIGIAHPDFRRDLREAARRRNLV